MSIHELASNSYINLRALEGAVMDAIKNKPTPPGTNPLLLQIQSNAELMIAFVFNQDHTSVQAIPIPEVYEIHHRPHNLITHYILASHDAVFPSIKERLENQKFGVLEHVIILAQNTGKYRSDSPFIIGSWNTNAALGVPQGKELTQHLERMQK